MKKTTTNLHVKISFKPLKKVYGWFHPLEGNKCEIHIRRGAPQLEQIETIYHEMTHLICNLLQPENCVKFLNVKAARKLGKGRHVVAITKSQDEEEHLCYEIANDSIKRIKEYLKK